ncbi:MAG: cytochrome c biogenesis protein ResB [Pyrinomonadaceae bacterium]
MKAPTERFLREKREESILSRLLKLICSVRLGVGLLIALGLACFIGMLVMQQNVDGFDRYFAELTPSQRLVYGSLGLFDIYHAWYFNALLALLSLNIVLASIDRFPKTWLFVSKPNVTVPIRWLRDQRSSSSLEVPGDRGEIAASIAAEMKNAGWKKTVVSEKAGKTFVFAESGLWNRFGYLAVHVSLLTIFFGGFLTAQLGSTGQMPIAPGETSNLTLDTVVELDQAHQITKQLPFEIICTDIQQKLIRQDGPITVGNTIDWLTYFQIKDETGTHEAFVQMNKPFDYRGYRFFQASFTPIGRARNITVRLTPEAGGPIEDIVIPRDGSVTLADGNMIRFSEFRGNFSIGREDPNEDTSAYPNPGAILQVFQPGQPPVTAYAFGPKLANMPVAKKPVAGYGYQLIDFEKAPDRHVLAVQRDPGSNVVYVGFLMLFITLVGVFFFSHQRVWAAIEKNADGINEVTLAGNTNRSQNTFDEKFSQFVKSLQRQEHGESV